MKILIVDDSKTMHELMNYMFLRTEWELLHVFNGAEALNTIQNEGDIGLIMLDINMPVMDGLNFLRRLRATPAYDDIKVVVVSTESSLSDLKLALELGAQAYVTKPVTRQNLFSVVEQVLEQDSTSS
jgi:two-component system chemotaxis response regulator CheY